MTTNTDRIAKYLAETQDAFEAGFASKAAQKRALETLSLAYRQARNETTRAILDARTESNDCENSADFWALPFELHHVRDTHFVTATKYSEGFAVVRDMIALRNAIKSAEISAPPVNEEKAKVETVRRTILEEMERRKATYVEGLDLGRMWNEMFPHKDGKITLPVSVNAHMVHGHKGTVFVRHFFYLRGKLTPLNTILAIAGALLCEKA